METPDKESLMSRSEDHWNIIFLMLGTDSEKETCMIQKSDAGSENNFANTGLSIGRKTCPTVLYGSLGDP